MVSSFRTEFSSVKVKSNLTDHIIKKSYDLRALDRHLYHFILEQINKFRAEFEVRTLNLGLLGLNYFTDHKNLFGELN